MKEILEKLNKRLKDMEKKQKKFKAQVDGTEDRIQTLADMHVDLARTIGNRLADLKIMSRTLELKIAEESLRQKTEALAEKTRAAEAAEKQRREMARLEADLQKIHKKPAHDALARTLIRDLEQQIAAMDAIMKTKLAAVPDQFGGLAKKAQEERMRQHFSRLDQRMQQIEDHFLQGQKMAEKPAIPVNRALVIVNLPVGAKLFVNDQFTKGEGSPRFFLTPELKIGTTYSYTLRMETFLNGTMVSSSQKIYFRAGKEAHAVFETTGGNVSEVRPAILP